MVSAIGSNSSQASVAQVLKDQQQRVDQQRDLQAQEQKRQAQVQEQQSTNVDENARKGRSVDINA